MERLLRSDCALPSAACRLPPVVPTVRRSWCMPRIWTIDWRLLTANLMRWGQQQDIYVSYTNPSAVGHSQCLAMSQRFTSGKAIRAFSMIEEFPYSCSSYPAEICLSAISTPVALRTQNMQLCQFRGVRNSLFCWDSR